MQTHVMVLGVLYIALNVAGLLVAALIFVVGTGAGVLTGDPEAATFVSLAASAVASCFLVLAAPGVLGGVGLLMHKNWARILVIILSVLNVLNFPLGTLLSVYSFWVLFHEETSELFVRD